MWFTHRHLATIHSDHGRPVCKQIQAKDRSTHSHDGIVCFHLNASAAAENILDVCPRLSQRQAEVNVALGLRRIIFSLNQPNIAVFIETNNTPIWKLEFQTTTLHGHEAFSSLDKSAKRQCTPRRFWCGLPQHFTLNESYPSSFTLYGKNEGFLSQNSWAQAKQHHRKQQDAPERMGCGW